RAAAWQRHPLGGARHRLEEIDLERVAHVVALGDEGGPRAGALTRRAEDVGETELVEPAAIATGSGAGAAARVLPEARVARVAAAVNLAAVIGAAFVGIAKNLVGRRNLFEP